MLFQQIENPDVHSEVKVSGFWKFLIKLLLGFFQFTTPRQQIKKTLKNDKWGKSGYFILIIEGFNFNTPQGESDAGSREKFRNQNFKIFRIR